MSKKSETSPLHDHLKYSTLPNDFLKSSEFKDVKSSPTSNRIFRKLSSQQKSLTNSLLDIKDSIKIHKKVFKESNTSNANQLNKTNNDESSTTVKTFKRTIIKKRLPPRLYIKAKQHLEAEKQEKVNHKIETIPESEESENMTLPKSPIKECPKREVILIKDENYGFGFIAGSEKPLVIRFVSQGNFNFLLILNLLYIFIYIYHLRITCKTGLVKTSY